MTHNKWQDWELANRTKFTKELGEKGTWGIEGHLNSCGQCVEMLDAWTLSINHIS